MYNFLFFFKWETVEGPIDLNQKPSQTYFKEKKKCTITSVIGIEVTKKTKDPYESKSTPNGEMSDTKIVTEKIKN